MAQKKERGGREEKERGKERDKGLLVLLEDDCDSGGTI